MIIWTIIIVQKKVFVALATETSKITYHEGGPFHLMIRGIELGQHSVS